MTCSFECLRPHVNAHLPIEQQWSKERERGERVYFSLSLCLSLFLLFVSLSLSLRSVTPQGLIPMKSTQFAVKMRVTEARSPLLSMLT